MSAGASPQTPLGSLQRSPGPLAGFKGAASLQEGNGGKGREGLGEEEEGKGEEMGMGKEGERGKLGAPWLLGDRRLCQTQPTQQFTVTDPVAKVRGGLAEEPILLRFGSLLESEPIPS